MTLRGTDAVLPGEDAHVALLGLMRRRMRTARWLVSIAVLFNLSLPLLAVLTEVLNWQPIRDFTLGWALALGTPSARAKDR